MTRAQWTGVVDFAKAVDAKILTSFATSEGAGDSSGAWNPEQARRLFANGLEAARQAAELVRHILG